MEIWLSRSPLRDDEKDVEARAVREGRFEIQIGQRSIVGEADGGAIAKAGLQSPNHQTEAAERFGVDHAVAEPPAVGADEPDILGQDPRGVAVRGLEMVWAKEHSFVPVDGSRSHRARGLGRGRFEREYRLHPGLASRLRWRGAPGSVESG